MENINLYKLKKGVSLVTGASRGAIIDTNHAIVYSINRSAVDVINKDREDLCFWRSLESLDLAEKCNTNLPEETQINPRPQQQLDFVWFEVITEECNNRCIHCYSNSHSLNLLKKKGINSKLESHSGHNFKRQMTHHQWMNAITDSYNLGCHKCQFIGGEPFLYCSENGEDILSLACYAKKTGYTNVEIFTNATLITSEQINKLKSSEIEIALSLFSKQPRVHDSITRIPGSHQKTISTAKRLVEAGIKVRAEIIIMKQNQDTIEETIKFREEMGLQGKKPDIIRPSGRGNKEKLFPEKSIVNRYGLFLEPDFSAHTISYYRNRTANPCLNGKLAIIENGNIIPCVFARNIVLGNYLDSNNLEEVISNDHTQKVWTNNLDNVLVCQDCEFRYVCSDCRPLSFASFGGNQDFYKSPNPRCTYNPYTGEWANGVWRLKTNNTPFYERFENSSYNNGTNNQQLYNIQKEKNSENI